ncbi:MAG TPA: rhomboid family intramembrane serine protease [Pirellulales bacterium]|nr:rhomboid family intramembrane serine protease [Pirellulales bacterium]
MGIYDREYYQEQRPGFVLGGGARTMVTNLILINVAVYILDLFTDGSLRENLSLRPDLFRHPWNAWQLLTAGFIHSYDMWHILVNMLVLFFFGRDVEAIYGRMEFLRIYLSLVVLSSLAWVVSQTIWDRHAAAMMGASGAVMGIMVLYILHFPRRMIYIWGVFPVPAWALGILYVGSDFMGFVGPQHRGAGPRVAYETHLAGAAFAALYYYLHINLGQLLPSGGFRGWRPRPRLRVHDPRPEGSERLDDRVDAILDKVSREGIDSLSASERQMLEDASRRYQRRRS